VTVHSELLTFKRKFKRNLCPRCTQKPICAQKGHRELIAESKKFRVRVVSDVQEKKHLVLDGNLSSVDAAGPGAIFSSPFHLLKCSRKKHLGKAQPTAFMLDPNTFEVQGELTLF